MTKRISPLELSREIWLARKISSNSETVGIYTFFEASCFGCCKTIFDATKVTYNTYSCVISGMSREMMKMDGRDSVECQNWEKKDIMVILEFVLNENNAKNRNSDCLLQIKKGENVRGERKLDVVAYFEGFRESLWLLSRNTRNRTVGFCWSRRQNCSTHRGLRVGSGFGSFRQTP